MHIFIRRVELETAIATRAGARAVPAELIVEEVLAQAFNVALPAEPWRVADRPAAIVMELIAAAPDGLTAHDIRLATGWQYRKTAAALARLQANGQIARKRHTSGNVGAPAWRYFKATTPPIIEASLEPPKVARPRQQTAALVAQVAPDEAEAQPKSPKAAARAALAAEQRLERNVARVAALLRASPVGLTMLAMMAALGQRTRTISAALAVLSERKLVTCDARVVNRGPPVQFYTFVEADAARPVTAPPDHKPSDEPINELTPL